jgi:hypothetical protein
METDFFAAMLVPPYAPSPEWAESLAETLLQPSFSISLWEALGRRLRRNYLWLYILLGVTWLLKLFLYPSPASNWQVYIDRAGLGPIPGWSMLVLGLVYNGIILFIGFATVGLRQASGEVLPKFGELPVLGELLQNTNVKGEQTGKKSPLQTFRRRQQLMSFIITAKPDEVSERIIREMKRGVTGLHGQGMYTHIEREVLMVVAMVTEMARLKSLIKEEDPNAFIAVTHAQAVFGRGFQALTK